ncbi:class I SAM-dependent methyltransferase [Amycolatopsis mongoliensis]|uniref:Class I SAM-dependent methyltransferase n=1 Tax=Amycolatopsis mongoliensis TaxID=715475 RepID=A0A9Y2JHS4_9PSEU|nr:class I SAM-dependent methyltransferase [Amycolatopsis sp. 4-36]WIX98312.1 class I SAM-dependent methyltransferase [Amycolatopsis sp. 4-36]
MSISVPLEPRTRPTRDDLVRAQYADAELVADYADAYTGWGPTARYHHSRLHAVDEVLRSRAGGDLLDIGCGPGMMVRHLLDTRPGDFRITACDRSAAMIDAVVARAGRAEVTPAVGDIENMPFPAGTFDVALAMGVLEYTDVASALREIARVLRPGGLLVATMLNPQSPYRLVEWGVFWPARRALGSLERAVGVAPEHRHGARRTGIKALSARRFRHELWQAGLQPEDPLFYDVTALVPPVDRFVRRWDHSWRDHPERTVSRGVARGLGSGYLMPALRPQPHTALAGHRRATSQTLVG